MFQSPKAATQFHISHFGKSSQNEGPLQHYCQWSNQQVPIGDVIRATLSLAKELKSNMLSLGAVTMAHYKRNLTLP